MSRNPFKVNKDYVNRPKRNSFDLSRTNHLTFNFGELIPVMCQETLPGDTFSIDSALGLRFMPLAFPIQTKCKAYVHFFYQRTKNLWDDFYDFINGNDKLIGKTVQPPFLGLQSINAHNSQANLQTGSLGDYLGLPTVSYGERIPSIFASVYVPLDFDPSSGSLPIVSGATSLDDISASLSVGALNLSPSTEVYTVDGIYWYYFPLDVNTFSVGSSYEVEVKVPSTVIDIDSSVVYCVADVVHVSDSKKDTLLLPVTTSQSFESTNLGGTSGGVAQNDVPLLYVTMRFTVPSMDDISFNKFNLVFRSYRSNLTKSNSSKIQCKAYSLTSSPVDALFTPKGNLLTKGVYNISALPFRCYESICNAFYRDDRNNPNKDYEGTLMYNKYLQSTKGGLDLNAYPIRYRNWELDQFTSCVQSPQMGVAPLVGITSSGEATFDYEGRSYKAQAEVADDGDTITNLRFSEDVPSAVARSAMNASMSGISINDFRNVNALQRWLETNIRRGLKQKDQAIARWGVAPSDSVLGMPEFIGGYSVDVDVNTVVNTSAQGSVALGDYSGNMSAFGGSKHKISHYCDDYGFIMAIVSVVPVPVYSQLLPKMFLRDDALKYYSPEFANLGLQPVTYGELCPLQLPSVDDSDFSKLNNNTVFGYQRPWYDYMYSNDEVHGLFRNELSQFILMRQFLTPPNLDADFLTVKPDSMNDVFTVKQRHNILGMIRFNVDAKRPLPLYSIPSIN